jgi:hypothetical protein
MDISTFDPAAFKATVVEGAFETHTTPLPEDTYIATIEETVIRAVKNDDGEVSILCDVPFLVDDEALAERLGLERLMVRQGFFLDLDKKGNLEFGPNKNVKLGKLRDALGQNTDKAWNFGQLDGAGPLKIKVIKKPDKDDSSIEYNRAVSFAPLG